MTNFDLFDDLNNRSNLNDLSDLISYIYEHPKQLTYVSIGCANLRFPNQVPPVSDRQQYPLFLSDLIRQEQMSARIILIDPNIESPPSIFMFFENIYETSFGNIFLADPNNVEIIILKKVIEHRDDDHDHHHHLGTTEINFFELLNSHILENDAFLLVQDFTGHDLSPMQSYFYEHLPMYWKSFFFKRITYDFTYGMNYGCMVDLSLIENQPILKKSTSGRLEIINYIYDSDINLKSLSPIQIKHRMNHKMYHFKHDTYVLFRQVKLAIFNNQSRQLDPSLFTNAHLNCYQEYVDFCNDPSNQAKINTLLSQLNDQLILVCQRLINTLEIQSDREEITVLIDQLRFLDEKNMYHWLNRFCNLLLNKIDVP